MPPKKKKDEDEEQEETKEFLEKKSQDEQEFHRISTVDHPSSVPEEFPREFFSQGFKPFKHQCQTIYLCLEAEKNEPFETSVCDPNNGQILGYANCLCKVGCIANGTGTGKSLCAAALACYDIEQTEDISSYSSNLMMFDYVSNYQRPVLPFSVMILKKTNQEKIISDLNKFMKPGYIRHGVKKVELANNIKATHVNIDQIDTTKAYAKKYLEYKNISRDTDLLLIEIEERDAYKNNKEKAKNLGIKFKDYCAEHRDELEDVDEMDRYLDLMYKYNDAEDKKQLEKDKIIFKKDELKVVDYMISLMKNKKLFICTSESFHLLFPLFEYYRVERIILDEPQEIVITNSKNFKHNKQQEIIDFLINPAGARTEILKENSPAVMIWLMSATIHQIFDNEIKGKNIDSRYFNAWVGRNAPFLRDYHNSLRKSFRTPEMTKKYIIKFSKEYTDNLLYDKIWYKVIPIKVKRNGYFMLAQNILLDKQEKLDNYLENDDDTAVKQFLEISDMNDISTGIVRMLEDKISELQKSIDETKLTGKAFNTYKETMDGKIKNYTDKIELIERRESVLLSDNDTFKCGICRKNVRITDSQEGNDEDWLYENASCFCPNCTNVTHYKCWHDLDDRLKCFNCKKSINEVKPCFFYADCVDDSLIGILENRNDKVYETKIDALNYILKNKTGKRILVYTDFLTKDEGKNEEELVRLLLKRGYDVVLTKNMTKKRLNEIYGDESSRIDSIKTENDTSAKIEEFRKNTENDIAWILDISKSTGMDFEFIDDIICYSKFNSLSQIIGRGMRPMRDKDYNVFVLSTNYENI